MLSAVDETSDCTGGMKDGRLVKGDEGSHGKRKKDRAYIWDLSNVV